jgi:hypothetical protein
MVFWEVFGAVFGAQTIAWLFRKYFEPILEDGHKKLTVALKGRDKSG